MNFHSCQTEGLPGEWSPRDLVLMCRAPSSSLVSFRPPFLLSPRPTSVPKPSKSKAPPSAFSVFSPGQTRESGRWPRQTLIRAGQLLPSQKGPVNSCVPSSHWNKRGLSLPDTYSIRLNTFYWQPLRSKWNAKFISGGCCALQLLLWR